MTERNTISTIQIRRVVSPCHKCQYHIRLNNNQQQNLEDHGMAKATCPECANTTIVYPPDTEETTTPIERQVTLNGN